MNSLDNSHSPQKPRIFCSPKLNIICQFINGVLFICAIISLGVGTYHLRVLNTNKKCSKGDRKDDKQRRSCGSSYLESYTMIAIGCILICTSVILIGVILTLARRTTKYVRWLSDKPPSYDEAIRNMSTCETRVDDISSVGC